MLYSRFFLVLVRPCNVADHHHISKRRDMNENKISDRVLRANSLVSVSVCSGTTKQG